MNINGLHYVRTDNDQRRVFRTAFFSDFSVDYTPQTVRINFQNQSHELVTKQVRCDLFLIGSDTCRLWTIADHVHRVPICTVCIRTTSSGWRRSQSGRRPYKTTPCRSRRC